MGPSNAFLDFLSKFVRGTVELFNLSDSDEVICIALLTCLFACGVAIVFYRRKFMGTKRAGLLWVLASGAAVTDVILALVKISEQGNDAARGYHMAIKSPNPWPWLVLMFALPFCVRMFNKWTGPILTEAERLPNGQGVRAWMGPGNVILAAIIAVCAWQGFGYPFLAVLPVLLCVIVAYPLINAVFGITTKQASAASPAPQPESPDLAEERHRILRMLEAGKISVDEADELLGALR